MAIDRWMSSEYCDFLVCFHCISDIFLGGHESLHSIRGL